MTATELYREIGGQLTRAGCEDAPFDALCLMEDLGGLTPRLLPAPDFREVSPECEKAVRAAAARRGAGEPLQYILGEWEFLTLRLKVGEGVLIPRPDTELLCETAAAWLNERAFDPPVPVYDLCAGSGCVGLGVCSLCRVPPSVTAVEWSPEAFSYLEENIARYPQYPVTAVRGNVLEPAGFSEKAAVILSNPPYIPTADLPALMREVQREPRMALDGDGDGLKFYRVIAGEWTKKLLPGGLCAVEVGVGQSEAVADLFLQSGLHNIRILGDLAGIPRVVTGERTE